MAEEENLKVPQEISSQESEIARDAPHLENKSFSYGEEDSEKWREGAAHFSEFWQQALNQHLDVNFTPHAKACLQAMFLGEKPATLISSEISQQSKDLLHAYGLQVEGVYVYDPGQVGAVIQKNAKELGKFGGTAEQVVKSLSSVDLNREGVARGLILGYPKESAIAYEAQQDPKAEQVLHQLYELLTGEDKAYLEAQYFTKITDKAGLLDFVTRQLMLHHDALGIGSDAIPAILRKVESSARAKVLNVYGVTWVDYGLSEESSQKQARLKKAFEQSGIIEHSTPNLPNPIKGGRLISSQERD